VRCLGLLGCNNLRLALRGASRTISAEVTNSFHEGCSSETDAFISTVAAVLKTKSDRMLSLTICCTACLQTAGQSSRSSSMVHRIPVSFRAPTLCFRSMAAYSSLASMSAKWVMEGYCTIATSSQTFPSTLEVTTSP